MRAFRAGGIDFRHGQRYTLDSPLVREILAETGHNYLKPISTPEG